MSDHDRLVAKTRAALEEALGHSDFELDMPEPGEDDLEGTLNVIRFSPDKGPGLDEQTYRLMGDVMNRVLDEHMEEVSQ